MIQLYCISLLQPADKTNDYQTMLSSVDRHWHLRLRDVNLASLARQLSLLNQTQRASADYHDLAYQLLGMGQQQISVLEGGDLGVTFNILQRWSQNTDSTIGRLYLTLKELEREDIVEELESFLLNLNQDNNTCNILRQTPNCLPRTPAPSPHCNVKVTYSDISTQTFESKLTRTFCSRESGKNTEDLCKSTDQYILLLI